MSGYIDVDETLNKFKELHGDESELLNCYNADWIVQFIEGQPEANVQEIKYGHWIKKKPKLGAVWCSECNRAFDGDSKYCPNCGAEMRLEDETNDH